MRRQKTIGKYVLMFSATLCMSISDIADFAQRSISTFFCLFIFISTQSSKRVKDNEEFVLDSSVCQDYLVS